MTALLATIALLAGWVPAPMPVKPPLPAMPAKAPAAEVEASAELEPAAGADEAEPDLTPDLTDEELAALGVDLDETITIVEEKDNVVPGAAQAVDAEQLERFEHDDVHRILGEFSGVYIREEDGYGLRPNIGMRGSGSERSAKIALMEDSILIAPAPYSAPAAYYFPLLTRMSRVEVLKGPASVRFGPNTVGGALNMITAPIPRERDTKIDIAAGEDLYGKLHASHAENTERFGMLIEGLKLRTDGFKQLDGGGDTGFDKNNVVLKLRGNTDVKGEIYNEVIAKIGYSDEVSNETYTGLSDADFDANPYRRYRATQLDRMDWTHTQLQLQHKIEIGAKLSVTTQLYRHDFDRSWRKLNGFATGDLAQILANPTAGNNAIFYSVLTGQTDSTGPDDSLLIGTNKRVFVSQGIQTAARFSADWLGFAHKISAGARLHYDEVERLHTEESYLMSGGALVRDSSPMSTSRDTIGSATAFALYAQDEANWGNLTVTAGNRVEMVSIEHSDRADAMNDADDFYTVMIPGGGVFYKLTEELGLLAGVHRGFVPVSPGQDQDVNPEKSVNYELGTRFGVGPVYGEAIGFFTDYSNLKGTCTFSSGCADNQVDDEFNGGEVHVLGVEASATAELRAGPLVVPLRGSYTFNRSRFQSSFSSSNPQWGDIEAGYEIPYLPSHQGSLGVGLIGKPLPKHQWEVSLSGRFSSAMRDVAGTGEVADNERSDAVTVLDLGASYQFAQWGKAYLSLANVFDQAHVVSRRPFGARPGKPRFVIVGYKNSFF